MKHDLSIDGLRFVANVLVVLFHASMFFDAATSGMIGKVLWGMSKSAWVVGMAVLCLVSGWCFFIGFDEQAEKDGLYSWWTNKMFRRVKRLLIPYLVWGVVFVLLYRVMGRFSQDAAARVSQQGADNLIGCIHNVFNFTTWVLYGPLWYLRALFLCTLLSIVWALAFRWLQNSWLRIVVAGLIGTMVYCGVKSIGLKGYPDYCIVLFGVGGGAAVACPKLTRFMPTFLARFAENRIVARWLLPTGMFLYVAHLAVNRFILMFVRGYQITFVYAVVFVGSCIVPIITWHVLNKICPRALGFLEGRW